jgi:serine/threonine-protein kinase
VKSSREYRRPDRLSLSTSMPSTRDPDSHGGPPSEERDPLVGSILDERYLIEERIATGGFAAIYRARAFGGRRVALKVLHPALARDPSMVARFRREGATLTQLHDPHTVTTLAVGETASGTCYIAMELLSGETLHARLLRVGALPWRTAIAISRAVCRSLAEAHALGVVHRDLKPANIHLEAGPSGSGDHVKVIDFGIVKIARGSAIDDGDELTHAGHMIGTYDYMSPEQIVGAACDAASDIYALGVVTYEMITGRRPFADATDPTSMMTAMLTQVPPPPSILAEVPPELDGIVLRCLQRDPGDRYGSVVELDRILDRLLSAHDTLPEAVPVPEPRGDTPAEDERTWIEPEPIALGEPLTGPRPWVMPEPVPRDPALDVLPTQPMPASDAPHTTWAGVGVGAKPHRPRNAKVFPVPSEPSAPPAAPPAWPWMVVAPPPPPSELARGSGRELPRRASRLPWIVLAVVCAVLLGLVLLL